MQLGQKKALAEKGLLIFGKVTKLFASEAHLAVYFKSRLSQAFERPGL